jgi:hypothetical protein
LVYTLFLLSFSSFIAARLAVEYFAFNSMSLDGRFQTFNIVRDMRAGCIPFVDCIPYLGLQTSYLLTASSYVVGETPFGVSVAAHTIAWTLATISVVLLLRFSGFSWRWTSIGAIFVLLVLRSVGPITLDPGNSLRAVRSAAPIVASLLLWLFVHRKSSKLPLDPDYGKAVAFGMIGGFFFLWSNDFGVATPVALLLVWAAVVEDWRRPSAALGRTALSVLACVVTVLAILSLSSGVTAWKNTSTQIATTQFWYFAPYGHSARLRELSDLAVLSSTAVAMIIGLFLGGISLAVKRFFLKDRSFANAMLLMIVLGTSGGGAIYNIFGQMDSEIWQIAQRVAPVVLLGQVVFWISFFLPKDGQHKSMLKAIPPFIQYALPVIIMAVLVAASFVKDARPVYWAYRTYQQNREAAGVVALEAARSALGAYPDTDVKAVGCFRRLRDRFDTAGIPENRRIWSQYTSALDLAAGSRQPTSAPTWIFLFSPEAKHELLRTVQAHPPALILTIANDYSVWANWLSRANWPLYKSILRHYEPALRTGQHIIWMRRERPLPEQPAQQCRATQISPDRLRIQVSPMIGSAARGAQWVEIDQRLSSGVVHGGLPVLGDRLQLNARIPSTDLLGPLHNLYREDLTEMYLFGLDPTEKVTTVPVTTRPGHNTFVDIQAFPANRGRVTAYGRCTATPIAPLELTLDRSPPVLESCAQLDAVTAQSMKQLRFEQ